MKLTPSVLSGPTVVLTPLNASVVPELTAVALSVPEVWAHIPYAMKTVDDVQRVAAYGLAEQAEGRLVSFTTRLQGSGELVGGTTIRLVDAALPSFEIGGTWIVPRHQRTRVNTEAKLLQLAQCFEGWGAERVELKTDALNERSRRAILRLGASEEGTLRRHVRRANGSLRDSVLFSIVSTEWARIRLGLEERLAK